MFAALAGAQEAASLEAAPLARKISSAPGVSELVLVRMEGGAWSPFGAGASPLSAIARAHGYLIVPAASEGMAAGALVAPYAASWSAR
jgi:molybdopterin biosynthesis enzyme